jgi:hypothetical protein
LSGNGDGCIGYPPIVWSITAEGCAASALLGLSSAS